MTPEVSPEDLVNHGDKALQLVHELQPGESIRWADAVNAAARMDELDSE